MMPFLWYVSVLVLLASVSSEPDVSAPPEVELHNGSLYAACRLRALTSGPRVSGHVLFKQDFPGGKLGVIVRINNLPKQAAPEPLRAVHIHQYGDLSRECNATGGHYNPAGADHPNHPGDFGNFRPQGGRIGALLQSQASLFGHQSVLGRAVVLHRDPDDLGQGPDAGSRLHGNSGRRIACCVIAIHPPDLWNMYEKQFDS